MGESLTVLAIVAVGLQLALQPPINNRLGDRVGRLGAALVSNTIGTTILIAAFVVVLASGNVGGTQGPSGLLDVPAWQMAGGLVGATWVAVSVVTVGRIGAGVVASAAITGQLISALFIDQFGWVGIAQQAVTVPRLVGAVLLITGTVLVALRSPKPVAVASETAPVGPARDSARRHFGALLTVFFTGLMMGFQHPLNGLLSETVGDFTSGLLNFIIGTALLLVVVAASGGATRITRVRGIRPLYLLGGLLGVITVIASLAAVKVIGATALAAALITGQLCGSVALDRVGAFGLERRPLTFRRTVGLLLLLAGTFLAVS